MAPVDIHNSAIPGAIPPQENKTEDLSDNAKFHADR